jgi:hypothetical protein
VQSRAWPADELVSELSIAARAIGIDEAALATALGNGQTIAQVARVNGVRRRQVVRALVSHVVASVADDIRRGDLTADQITWLVTLATWRAEHRVTSAFPPMELLPVLGAHDGGTSPPARPRNQAAYAPAAT